MMVNMHALKKAGPEDPGSRSASGVDICSFFLSAPTFFGDDWDLEDDCARGGSEGVGV